MHLTPDQISSARKARSMTQEQLAAAMNVSRQTVSHWENGRVQPDEEAMQRLAELLAAQEPFAPAAASVSKANPAKPFLLGFICGVLVTLLAVFAFSHIRPAAPASEAKPASTQKTDMPSAPKADSRYTPAFYQQENVREEGKAHLVFSLVKDPITVIERDREPSVGWEVDYRFQEVNDVSFTITAFTEVYFTADGEITYSGTFKGEELSIPFDDVNMPAGSRIRYSVFKPVDATTLYCALIEGVDGNGNERQFRYAIPLSQEISK